MQLRIIFLLICLREAAEGSMRVEYAYAPIDLNDELTQDLYKRLSQIDSDELQKELLSPSLKESSRDSEFMDHTQANSRFIYVSGGAGEGKQHLKPDGSVSNQHQVKSDDILPFYCHPPNPCPKGFTGKDGCHDFVEDTAEYQKDWIKKMQAKGLCSCDEEHMFECESARSEADAADDEVDNGDANDDNIDQVIDSIVNSKRQNPYLHSGVKRQSLVAKKSPRIKRDLRDRSMDEAFRKYSKDRKSNPYLEGRKLRTVAKKGSKG